MGADRQILAQHACPSGDGGRSAAKYFYLRDRLGSVRLVLADDGAVKNTYTYEPFGDMLATECTETTENPFRFTGQWFDSEIGEYYFRARQYNPHIARFTSRDPVRGKCKKPLTLHKYLYCMNDPGNTTDPSGKWAVIGAAPWGISHSQSYGVVGRAMTVATFYGVEDGTYNVFFGAIAFKSWGVGPGIGLSGGFSVGFSENAQRPEDLAGRYRELRWSLGPPGVSVGASYARSMEGGANIDMVTLSLSFSPLPGELQYHWGKAELLCADSWTEGEPYPLYSTE